MIDLTKTPGFTGEAMPAPQDGDDAPKGPESTPEFDWCSSLALAPALAKMVGMVPGTITPDQFRDPKAVAPDAPQWFADHLPPRGGDGFACIYRATYTPGSLLSPESIPLELNLGFGEVRKEPVRIFGLTFIEPDSDEARAKRTSLINHIDALLSATPAIMYRSQLEGHFRWGNAGGISIYYPGLDIDEVCTPRNPCWIDFGRYLYLTARVGTPEWAGSVELIEPDDPIFADGGPFAATY